MAGKVLATIGIVLHLAVGVFPYAASGLLAPLEGVVALYALWIALLVVAVRLARDPARRRFTIVVPLAAVAMWFAVMTFGDVALGWTA